MNFLRPCRKYNYYIYPCVKSTHLLTKNLVMNSSCKYIYNRALRSRSLRDGSLTHKGRFATFVRSCSTLRASMINLETLYTISMNDYPGISLDASQSDYFEISLLLYIHMTIGVVTCPNHGGGGARKKLGILTRSLKMLTIFMA